MPKHAAAWFGLKVSTILSLFAVLSACGTPKAMPDGGDGGPLIFDLTVDLTPPSCTDPSTFTFTSIRTGILPRCAGDGCHRQAPFSAGLDLTDANAYTDLVNVASMEVPTLKRVAPGSPADSFVWHKLDAELPQDDSQGQPMPLGAENLWFPLSAAERAQVYCWIQANALNN
jgi:hypothetical protein